MPERITLGVALAVIAGFLQGALMLPLRFTRSWRWENAWLIFVLTGYLILPWVFAFATVPTLLGVYSGSRITSASVVALFGLAFGIAGLLFGLACELLGMALGFTLILGLGTTVGTLVPLIAVDTARAFGQEELRILYGLATMVCGVAICGWAGRVRNQALHGATEAGASRSAFHRGVLFAVLSGLLSPLINLALVFGSDLTEAALAFGANPQFAPNVLWTLIGSAAFVPNALYCARLLRNNQSGRLFMLVGDMPRNVFLMTFMGLLWIGTTILYGSATVFLGQLGPSIGWPIFISLLIVSSNVWGVLLGEWSGNRAALRTMLVGLAVLICAVFVISR